MRKLNFWLTSLSAVALSLTACSEDKGGNEPMPTPAKSNDFHIAFANGTGSNSATLVQGVSDLTTGTISSEKGYRLESSRTARIFSSADGSSLWSLNYTVGTIEKLDYSGSDKYTKGITLDSSIPLKTKTVRLTKINDRYASVHYITATADVDTNTKEYKGHKHALTIGILDLSTMQLLPNKTIVAKEIALPAEYKGYSITRIDAPVLSNGKLYYGCAAGRVNPANPTARAGATDKAFTLVVDFDTLSDIKFVTTDVVRGTTNGYRTPTQHIAEDGSIYQLVSGVQANKKTEVHIAKLQNGAYTSYDLNLTTILGKETRSDGFFYAGNGIAYIPYEDLSKPQIELGVDPDGKPTMSAMWKLARVDLNAKTAIDLEVPDNLWLRQYQNAVVRNGVFYIALAPIGKEGNIYMFDVNSTSPKGRLGAKLMGTGAEQYFIGIY